MTEQDDPRGVDDEGVDDDEGDEGGTEETNGHVQFGTAGAPAAAPAPTQAPRAPQQRKPRRRHGGGPPPGRDAWEVPGGKGTSVSAMEVWPELIEEMKSKGKTPYDLAVRVVCIDPPPTRPMGNAFDASAIVGDRSTSPSDKLYQMVRDNYHMTWAKVSCIYDIQFVWKVGGNIARRGQLIMPHPDEIIALQRNMPHGPEAGRQAGGYPQMNPQPPPTQWGSPQYEQPQQRPPWPQQGGYPHPGYAQSGYAPPGEESVQLRAELQRERENNARMQGQLNEIVSAMREGRAPNMAGPAQPAPAPAPAPPPAAAPAQQVDLDGVVLRILDRMGLKPGFGAPAPAQATAPAAGQQPQLDTIDLAVLRVLERFGLKPGMPGIGVGAPPTSPKTAVDEAEAAFNAFERMLNMMGKFRGFTKKADRIFSDDPVDAAGAVVEDANEGKLPFDAVAIPEVKWGDGRPVMYTADPETGKIDWTAAAFANPAVVEKVADGLNRFMSTLGRVVQAASKQQQGEEAEVVDETPADAKDAGDGGSWGGLG